MVLNVGSLCFRLFPFPTSRKNPQDRLKWKQLLNRQIGVRTPKLWSPGKQSRVCSKHFKDGRPTSEHPYPTLFLGYDAKRKSEQVCGGAKRRKLTYKGLKNIHQVENMETYIVENLSNPISPLECLNNSVLDDPSESSMPPGVNFQFCYALFVLLSYYLRASLMACDLLICTYTVAMFIQFKRKRDREYKLLTNQLTLHIKKYNKVLALYRKLQNM